MTGTVATETRTVSPFALIEVVGGSSVGFTELDSGRLELGSILEPKTDGT